MSTESIPRRGRGRPTVFSDEMLRQASEFSYAKRVTTRRAAQDLVYRRFAVVAIELYCEAFPDKAPALSWLFRPRMRHTLLSELGRVAHPRADDQGVLRWKERDVARLVRVALEIAEAKPSTKAGVAMIRERRRAWRSTGTPG